MEPSELILENSDTIAAISTPSGVGGIAVLRLSGPDALAIADKVWKGKRLSAAESHSAHLGQVIDAEGNTLDRAVATVFRGPRSFTGDDTVELSLHGSVWIQRAAMDALCKAGARAAQAGEFTKRAFINGRLDLAQAEGVADLIVAESKAAHRLAMTQLNGRFSAMLDSLRRQLIDLASLIELELDFSEEDVEFADRSHLYRLAATTRDTLGRLVDSYESGQAFKNGVPVVIAGAPNAGKSTLLNHLLDDERAIVSDIPGTTRDIVEDTREIGGILFRFRDTAGLRATSDTIEQLGIDRARDAISRAAIVIWVIDSSAPTAEEDLREVKVQINAQKNIKHIIILNKSDLAPAAFEQNGELAAEEGRAEESKPGAVASGESSGEPSGESSGESTGESSGESSGERSGEPSGEFMGEPSGKSLAESSGDSEVVEYGDDITTIRVSAKTGEGCDRLIEELLERAKSGHNPETDIIVTNARHKAALQSGKESIERVMTALQATHPAAAGAGAISAAAGDSAIYAAASGAGISDSAIYADAGAGISDSAIYADAYLPTDLIAQDLREAIHHISTVTGKITTDTLLSTIFSRFCIGK